jgi:hypothetical protein
LAEADLAFFLTNGTVRPYLKAGARGIFPTETESGAELAGVALPIEIESVQSGFSPFGGAGVRVGFLKNGFAEIGANYGGMPGGGSAPSVEFGAGWKFGGGNRNAQLADKECKKSDDLPVLIRPAYNRYLTARLIDKKTQEEAMKAAFVGMGDEDDRTEWRNTWREPFKKIYENEGK